MRRNPPSPGLILGIAIVALGSTLIPLLAIPFSIMGMVLATQNIRRSRASEGPPSGLAFAARITSLLAFIATLSLMGFALPVALGW